MKSQVTAETGNHWRVRGHLSRVCVDETTWKAWNGRGARDTTRGMPSPEAGRPAAPPATHSRVARELRIPFTFLNTGGKKQRNSLS